MPIPGERPICHYSGEQCKHEGAACTCLLPNFQGTPPTYPSDAMRAELDKCDGLTADDKEYLLRIAFAGLEYAKKLQVARAAPAKSEPERDGCTDPSNCKRCKAATWDQLKYEHAGIPVGPQRNAGVMGMDEVRAKRIRDALRAMQEMWDHLRRKGLNEELMREYSNALTVLEDDFTARLPDGAGGKTE